jgi:hypothetical protein
MISSQAIVVVSNNKLIIDEKRVRGFGYIYSVYYLTHALLNKFTSTEDKQKNSTNYGRKGV